MQWLQGGRILTDGKPRPGPRAEANENRFGEVASATYTTRIDPLLSLVTIPTGIKVNSLASDLGLRPQT